jgi:hypothetical protein
MSDARTVLVEWQQRTDAATEGPWDLRTTPWDAYIQAEAARNRNDRDGVICNEARSVDAEFIATARTAIPALLSAVRNVLALCDDPYIVEFGADDEPQDGILVAHVRKALNDALLASEPSGSEE